MVTFVNNILSKRLCYIIAIVFLVQATAFSQNCVLELSGYGNNKYLKYFDSIHQIRKTELKGLNQTYLCHLVCKINPCGRITNLEFLESPDLPLDKRAKSYLEMLFLYSDGMWEYRNCENIDREEKDVLFSVQLFYKKETLEQRAKISDQYFWFLINGLKFIPRAKGISFVDEKIIYLIY